MAYSHSGAQARAARALRATMVAKARELFMLRGYEGVTMRQVAAASGISTGALYHRWPTQEALFAEAMGRPLLTDARGAELLDALRLANPGHAQALVDAWTPAQ